MAGDKAPAKTDVTRATGTTAEALPIGTCVPAWSYNGTIPETWGALKCNPKNECATGKRQSPITYSGEALNNRYMDMFLRYSETLVKTYNVRIDNFLQMKIEEPTPPTIQLDNTLYYLKELNIHFGDDDITGSEHVCTSLNATMEVQFIHVRDARKDIFGSIGELPGVGVVAFSMLYEVEDPGAVELGIVDHDLIATILQNVDVPMGATKAVNLSTLVPTVPEDSYAYLGSLPYPPCSEGVSWIIYKQSFRVKLRTLHLLRSKVTKRGSRPARVPYPGEYWAYRTWLAEAEDYN